MENSGQQRGGLNQLGIEAQSMAGHRFRLLQPLGLAMGGGDIAGRLGRTGLQGQGALRTGQGLGAITCLEGNRGEIDQRPHVIGVQGQGPFVTGAGFALLLAAQHGVAQVKPGVREVFAKLQGLPPEGNGLGFAGLG